VRFERRPFRPDFLPLLLRLAGVVTLRPHICFFKGLLEIRRSEATHWAGQSMI
jgi:hypothetical protein